MLTNLNALPRSRFSFDNGACKFRLQAPLIHYVY